MLFVYSTAEKSLAGAFLTQCQQNGASNFLRTPSRRMESLKYTTQIKVLNIQVVSTSKH